MRSNLPLAWYKDGKRYTTDGALLNDSGYRKLAPMLADALFGKKKVKTTRLYGPEHLLPYKTRTDVAQ